jgi:hypothetical protein
MCTVTQLYNNLLLVYCWLLGQASKGPQQASIYYYIILYLFLTAIGLTPSGSSTVHIYTQTVCRIQRMEHT